GMADARRAGKGIRGFVCPGNDDQLEIDAVVEAANTVELGEGRVVDIDGFQLASSGWANRTPWDTYREEDEPDLKKRIDEMLQSVTAEPERTIYSLHCPPYATGRGDAPHITAQLERDGAGPRSLPRGH